MKKRFIVCDYPNPKNYTFPSFGFGSSEKRVWQIARSLSEMEDVEVIITGPLWLTEHVPNAIHVPYRLDSNTVDKFLREYGHVDYLFAGHEYFDKPFYTDAFFQVANKLGSYILHPYEFKKTSVFDAKRAFLFCYSDEMKERYASQKPIKLLLFHSGVGEKPYLTSNPDSYLVWMGRLDAVKAPHYAILAAAILNKTIKILGKSVYDPSYEAEYSRILNMPHVTRCGVVFGTEKMRLLSEAECALYTCSPEYSEAGAGTLGEILCSGVPIAGMTWKDNDAVVEAVNDPQMGRIVHAQPGMNDGQIAAMLAEAVKQSLKLDRKNIFDLANRKYDMHILMKRMMNLMDEGDGAYYL